MKLKLLVDHQIFIPTIARWYYDQWGRAERGNSVETVCERIRGDLNRDRAPLHIVALDGDDLLGVTHLKIKDLPACPDKKYWLGGVYVAPKARGGRVASELVEKAAEMARSFGINALYLQTEKLEGGGLYGKLGWSPIGRDSYQGADVLVMERIL